MAALEARASMSADMSVNTSVAECAMLRVYLFVVLAMRQDSDVHQLHHNREQRPEVNERGCAQMSQCALSSECPS